MQPAPLTHANVGAQLDTSALRDPVDPAELRGFVAANRQQLGWTPERTARLLRDVVTVTIAAVCLGFALLIALFFLLLVVALVLDPGSGGAAGLAGTLLSPLVLVLVFLFGRLVLDAVRGSVRPRPKPKRAFRLARLGAENGLAYRPIVLDPAREGTLFAAGQRRTARDVLTTPDGRFEIGNYSYAGRGGSERALRRFGYVRIALPEALPHMVLESRANRRIGRSNLPWQFRGGQRLRLEGDFDRHFRLFVPDDYERDALRLFTPDVMALLIDRLRPFDVEVVDRALFLYSRVPFDMTAPATYHRALAIAETVGRPTVRLAQRWRDERTTRGDLAHRGRRLAVRPAVGAIIATAYVVALIVRWAVLPS